MDMSLAKGKCTDQSDRYYNRYPGVMCDVEGYCYVPFLEETKYRPRHKYSYGHEIRGQLERSADHFGIQGQFCTTIDSKIWDDEKRLWVVTMTRAVGEPLVSMTFTVSAEFVVLSGCGLYYPKIPLLRGWDAFYKNTHVFHSARWDYEYTGGTPENPDLVKLKGKHIAIMGTGATAIQIVPELAKWADHVYVVQRTPSYVGARGQRETDPEYWTKLTSEKGWQEKRRTTFDSLVSNSAGSAPDIIDDGWTHTPAGSGFIGSDSKIVTSDGIQEHIQALHELDFPRTEELRARVDEIVKDKATAEKLKAWYGSWCKRPSFHDDYLETFNLPNVTLIDTDGRGLDGYTSQGMLLDGTEYPIDALVLATGFTFGMLLDPSEKLGAVITGREGLSMTKYWKAPESGTLLGVAMPGFPNMFSYLGRGSGVTWNYASIMEMQAKLIANIIVHASTQKSGQRIVIEATKDGEDKYGREVAKRALWFSAVPVCTPGYFNGEGAAAFEKEERKTEEQIINEGKKAPWGAGPLEYKKMVGVYIAKGDLEGFTVEVAA